MLALLALAGAGEPDRMELARLCSRIENDWVGAQTGLLDQIASLFGEPDRALRIDFRSLEVRPVTLSLGDFLLVTVDSGEQPRERRLRLQRAARRVRRGVRTARRRQPARGRTLRR